MASEIYNVIEALSREKGIDPQIVVSAVEDAIVVATRKILQERRKTCAPYSIRRRQDPRVRGEEQSSSKDEQLKTRNLQISLDEAKARSECRSWRRGANSESPPKGFWAASPRNSPSRSSSRRSARRSGTRFTTSTSDA